MRPTTLLGIAFVGIFGFLVVNSFGDQVGGWETFEDAAASGREAHVVGTWVREAPSTYDPSRNVFSFTMADTSGTVRPVVYANPKPANFEDAERVVVQGQIVKNGTDEVFQAEHILVKCPSKYNEGGEFQDVEADRPGMPMTQTSARSGPTP